MSVDWTETRVNGRVFLEFDWLVLFLDNDLKHLCEIA
jgi:hypothetical protein